MLFTKQSLKKNLLMSLFLIFSLILFAACSSDGDANSNDEEHAAEHEMEHEEEGEHNMEEMDHEMEEMDHEHSEERIANPDGASISITSPADDATFAEGEEILVEVEVNNFELGADGNHWHVYVDGTSWGMVMGENTSQSLNGVEAGDHHIEVYLAGGDHIEFEEGSSIHVTVE